MSFVSTHNQSNIESMFHFRLVNTNLPPIFKVQSRSLMVKAKGRYTLYHLNLRFSGPFLQILFVAELLDAFSIIDVNGRKDLIHWCKEDRNL